jgi:rRNA maturation RNase YbeY
MIYFHTENIAFILKHKQLLKRWITQTVESKRKQTGEINFIFCSDDYLLSINQQYLQHDTLTDIITFDYSKGLKNVPISGDIFISVERVKENAARFSKTIEDELHRIMIHGVLHLLGYKDKTKADKQEMTRQEDLYLKKRKQRKIRK